MPREEVGVVHFIVQCVICAQLRPRLRAKQADPVNLAALLRDVFLEPPPYSAKEVELPFFWLPIGVGVFVGQCVVDLFIKVRALNGNRIGTRVQIVCLEINHICQHRIAAFFGVKMQHFFEAMCLGERVKQVFSVVTVIDPLPVRGTDDTVYMRATASGSIGL